MYAVLSAKTEKSVGGFRFPPPPRNFGTFDTKSTYAFSTSAEIFSTVVRITQLKTIEVFFVKILWELFSTFFKIGAFTFGGGYAMLSLIQREVVENKKWASDEEVLDYYAVAQCTPGVIAVNTATFVGYKKKGVLGAIAATFGVVFPSLIIISVIAAVLQNFMQYTIVGHILAGIRVAVAVLIINAVVTMGKKAIVDKLCAILAIIAFLVSVMFPSVSPVFIVLAAALVGIATMKKGGESK